VSINYSLIYYHEITVALIYSATYLWVKHLECRVWWWWLVLINLCLTHLTTVHLCFSSWISLGNLSLSGCLWWCLFLLLTLDWCNFYRLGFFLKLRSSRSKSVSSLELLILNLWDEVFMRTMFLTFFTTLCKHLIHLCLIKVISLYEWMQYILLQVYSPGFIYMQKRDTYLWLQHYSIFTTSHSSWRTSHPWFSLLQRGVNHSCNCLSVDEVVALGVSVFWPRPISSP
jgi:hypothetical protein